MAMCRLYDAHNHLHDERLSFVREKAIVELRRQNLGSMVVNGSSEKDWPQVLALSRAYQEVIPSFGYHPWYIKERSPNWEQKLSHFLEELPSGIGEVGLDRWIKDYDLEDQEQVFTAQLRLAARLNRPVSMHCLQAWGRLYQILREVPLPERGFVLHSFGGPAEMIPGLVELGAYFSLPGYYSHARKTRQQTAFKKVPRDRLLLETDAPDQCLPPERVRYPLQDLSTGKAINHPANLIAVYQFASELFGESMEDLAYRIEENFRRLFGSLKPD
jgi:TatD DNase family protein